LLADVVLQFELKQLVSVLVFYKLAVGLFYLFKALYDRFGFIHELELDLDYFGYFPDLHYLFEQERFNPRLVLQKLGFQLHVLDVLCKIRKVI